MLLHKSNEPFDDPDYISELKLDGIRLIVSKMDDQMKLYTRHHNDVTALFPELHSIDIPDERSSMERSSLRIRKDARTLMP